MSRLRMLGVAVLALSVGGCSFHVDGLSIVSADLAGTDGGSDGGRDLSGIDGAVDLSVPLDGAPVDQAVVDLRVADLAKIDLAIHDLATHDLDKPHDLAVKPADLSLHDLAKPVDMTKPHDLDVKPADLLKPADLDKPVDMLVPGSLSCTVANSDGTTADLTYDGLPPGSQTIDWAHWGITSATSVDRKNVPTHLIGTLTHTGTLTQYSSSTVTFTWSDGTPTVMSAGTKTGLYVGNGSGFTLPVTAGTTPHTVKLYISAFNSNYALGAHLSDSSAADYSDGESRSGIGTSSYRVYTCSFNASRAAQTLTFTWTSTSAFIAGNITVESALVQ